MNSVTSNDSLCVLVDNRRAEATNRFTLKVVGLNQIIICYEQRLKESSKQWLLKSRTATVLRKRGKRV